MIGGGLQRLANRFGAGPVAGDARQAALLRPAAVAVHDDRDVARDRPAHRRASRPRPRSRRVRRSLAEDFLFLGVGGVVDLLDRVVGQLLHLDARAACARPR